MTGSSISASVGAGGAFFLLASISMRLLIKSLEGSGRYFYLTSRHMLFDTFLERRTGHRPDDLIDELPVFEEEEGRDAHDHVSLRDLRVLVRVELHERDFARILLRELFDDRGDRATRRAPLRPEIDDDVGFLLDDLVELGVGDMNWLVSCGHRNLLLCHDWHLVFNRMMVPYKSQPTTPEWVRQRITKDGRRFRLPNVSTPTRRHAYVGTPHGELHEPRFLGANGRVVRREAR